MELKYQTAKKARQWPSSNKVFRLSFKVQSCESSLLKTGERERE
jgi:hypothetical protein